MIRINLLGDALVQTGAKKDAPEAAALYESGEQKSFRFPIVGVLIFVILAAVSGVYYVMLTKKVDAAKATNAELQAKKQELQKYFVLEKQYKEKKEALEKKKKVITDLRLAQRAPVYLLTELSNALPEGVWFTKLTQKGKTVFIEGESNNFESVNLFKNRLTEQNQFFSNVQYPKAEKKGAQIVFSLSFDFKSLN
nr:PilN domain-containing protein [uncultured Holophaga sp.]